MADDLTVVVPFKRGGREDWLDEALASIPADTRYIVAENDGELADALNQAIRMADTEYVLRLDADDILDTDSIALQVAACWDVDVAYPSLLHLSEDGEGSHGLYNPGEFCPNRLMVWNYIPGQGAVMRREAVLAAGGFRHMDALEDWDLYVRMMRNGSRFKWVADSRYLYRNVSSSRNKIPARAAEELKREIVGAEPDLLATFYHQETVATTYWRCLLPARALPGQAMVHRPRITISDGGEVGFEHHRGVAVWQFPGLNYERLTMAAMQEHGIPCLVESDDNYLVQAPGRTWRKDSPGRGEEFALPSMDIHRKIVGWADGLIVTTEHLAKQYRKATDAPIFVCPNQIDPDDWQETRLPDWYDPEKTYVGLAGSASHRADVPLVMRALEWAAKQRDVEVVILGSAVTRDMVRRFPFRHVPWTTDIAVVRALMKVLDVALAPVRETPWSSCRSDVKCLEYLMAGAAPVLSDVTPYKGWADGEFCRKASTSAEFLRAVQDLASRPDERRQMVEAGRAHVLAERTMEANAWRWREACDVKLREAVAA